MTDVIPQLACNIQNSMCFGFRAQNAVHFVVILTGPGQQHARRNSNMSLDDDLYQ